MTDPKPSPAWQGDWLPDPPEGCKWIPCRDCDTAGYLNNGDTCPTCEGQGALLVEASS